MKRVILLLLPALIVACSTQTKLQKIRRTGVSAQLSLPAEEAIDERPSVEGAPRRDTLTVEAPDGKQLILMRAVRDELTGEMVACEQLDAVVVTARFRHVAERHGKVELAFQISVPDSLLDARWQLCFHPRLLVLGDTLSLDPIYITGADFRKGQLRGYQQYARFLQSIARDSLHFVDENQLEIFLERNLPQIFRFKSDTSLVSDEAFASAFGVTQRQAVEHYTNHLLKQANARKIARKGKMWEKYVRNPIIREGIRLDTVLRESGRFEYCYTHTLATRPGLRRADVFLSGDLRDAKSLLYRIPQGAPLTFYISSLSSFADLSPHYKTEIVERRAESHQTFRVDFAAGRSEIDPSLGGNRDEIARICRILSSLLENSVFELDSILVGAGCSPEGSFASNRVLSGRRSESVSAYFRRYLNRKSDSLRRERGFSVDEHGRIHHEAAPRIPFRTQCLGEDWEGLDRLVQEDTLLSAGDKARYARLAAVPEPDARELALRGESFYPRLRQALYPRLRSVRFAFHLHRKGMVKDTVHTTVLDTLYMEGVQAIQDRDYLRAVGFLAPYGDYNTAVAYLALERNASAQAILERLRPDARIHYMLAILAARDEDEAAAVSHYLKACALEPSYVHRGRLDPEIAVLIERYRLHDK